MNLRFPSSTMQRSHMQKQFDALPEESKQKLYKLFQSKLNETSRDKAVSPTWIGDPEVLEGVGTDVKKDICVSTADSKSIRKVFAECIELTEGDGEVELQGLFIGPSLPKSEPKVGNKVAGCDVEESMYRDTDSNRRLRFSRKVDSRLVPNKKYYDLNEYKHKLWNHPSIYQEAQEELKDQCKEVYEKLIESGREVPNRVSGKALLNPYQQPPSTQNPPFPLAEID